MKIDTKTITVTKIESETNNDNENDNENESANENYTGRGVVPWWVQSVQYKLDILMWWALWHAVSVWISGVTINLGPPGKNLRRAPLTDPPAPHATNDQVSAVTDPVVWSGRGESRCFLSLPLLFHPFLSRAAPRFWKSGRQVRERKFFLTPHLRGTWGVHKMHVLVVDFHNFNMKNHWFLIAIR
jgi:hypothetical protein